MELQTSPRLAPEAGASARRGDFRALYWTAGLFILFWVGFYALNRALPYLKNGSDIVFGAKVRLEEHGTIFPPRPGPERVMIFGDSKVLAGFLPSLFDRLASAQGIAVSSFNSGLPGTDVFLPELKAVVDRGQGPDVLLLTLPWRPDPAKRSLFHLVNDDHAVIQALFPFRLWPMDAADFAFNAASHGGFLKAYREAKSNEREVAIDRGYYLITEQSRFPNGQVPSDFHLASDNPNRVVARAAPAQSAETGEMNGLIRRGRMRCFYLPQYMRIGEAAPAPPVDKSFAAIVERETPCKVLGPDYFLYPNRYFSDQTHLNRAGALVYTAALFNLVKGELRRPGTVHAIQ